MLGVAFAEGPLAFERTARTCLSRHSQERSLWETVALWFTRTIRESWDRDQSNMECHGEGIDDDPEVDGGNLRCDDPHVCYVSLVCVWTTSKHRRIISCEPWRFCVGNVNEKGVRGNREPFFATQNHFIPQEETCSCHAVLFFRKEQEQETT